MEAAQELRRTLADLLEQEIAAAQDFAQALDSEHAALTGDTAQALQAAVESKARALARLEAVGTERRAKLRGAGYGEDTEGVESWLARCDRDGVLLRRWETLCELARECRNANRINGGIIELAERHAERALAVLRGAPADAETYGPTGRSTSLPGSRSLAEA